MFNKFIVSIILTLCCSQQSMAETAIPDAIKVPDGNLLLLTVHAKGDQVYLCALNAGTYAWKWQAPDAKLYDMQNQALVGSHGAGPSWKYQDGSSTQAKVIQKAEATDKNNVPWLLLEVTGHQSDGLLGKVSYIQRINTQGGMPPPSGCDGNHLGAEAKVLYSADYSFYGH